MNSYKTHIVICLGLAWLLGCSASKEIVEPRIITMFEWGGIPANDTLAKRHSIQYLTLHHGGEPFPREKDPIQYLHSLQQWSRNEKHWIDIPYHYIVDLQGRIYEGRNIQYVGDTNTEYDPTGHALICVVGNYEEIEPSPQQLHALVLLMTMLSEKYHISSDHIKGHLDYSKITVCPGKNLYRYLSNGYFQWQVDSLRSHRARPQ